MEKKKFQGSLPVTFGKTSFQITFRSRPYRQCIGGSHTIYCTGSSTAMVVPFSELFSTQI